MVKPAIPNQYPCRSILQGKHPLRVPRGIVGLVPFMAAALISFSSLPAGAQTPYNEMVDLGTLKDDNSGWSEARALSADGSVAAGRAQSDTESYRAFRWTQDSGMVDLGTLRDNNTGLSEANALSADGSVVAGQAYNDAGEPHAFRWTEASGMVDLGTLRDDNSGRSRANALSADGSVVAGWAETDDGSRHAFIYRSIMQDYDNLLVSYPLLANDADVATAAQQWALTSILDQTCFAGRKGGACLSLGGRFSYTGSDGAHDLLSCAISAKTRTPRVY